MGSVLKGIIPEYISNQGEKKPRQELLESMPNQTDLESNSENGARYPYAPMVIGLLLIGGASILAAFWIYGRG